MLTQRSSRLPTVSLTLARLCATVAAVLLASVTFAVPSSAVLPAVQPATQGPCGDKPCGPVPGNPTPCGDKACGPVAGNPTPCGDKACGPVAGNPLPCPGCGAAPTNGNPNQPGAASSQSTPTTLPPAKSDLGGTQDSATTTTAGPFQQPGQAAPPFDPRKTSGSSSGWMVPVALVGLVALVFVLLVRRQRRRVETPS